MPTTRSRLVFSENPFAIYETDEGLTYYGGALDTLTTDKIAEVPEFLDGRAGWGWASFERDEIHVVVPAVRRALTELPAENRVPRRFALADDGYRERVADVVRRIKAGEADKVVVSRTVPLDFDVDLVGTFVRGRGHNTAARAFVFQHGRFGAAGFSPETMLEVTPDRRFVTRVLAGTKARTGDPTLDAKLCEELLSDPKEVFEHAITVRSAIEELQELGPVTVEGFMTVRPRGPVQHLESTLTGSLQDGMTAWDALDHVFPAAAITGIPSVTAQRIISEVEPRRGLYGGAVFTAGADGSLDVALALRTVFRDGGRSWLRAGAGITAQSRPEREFEESAEKLASVAPHVVAR